MKRLVKGMQFFVIMMLLISFILPRPSLAADTFNTNADSAIIVDFESGKILYGKNINEALPPASMTKMMTEYIILEKIADGDLSWDTTTQISDLVYEISANKDFSGIGLKQNVDYTVEDLFNAMVINSDNATSIALAELVADSEGEFVKLMNQKAEQLKLKDSKFVNSTGLDNESLKGKHPEGTKADDTNLLSAKDAARLAYHLIKDFPESLETSKIPSIEFDGQTIVNWNWMLDHDAEFLKQFYYEGVDGLKTGHTELAKFAFTSTAKREDDRLITVVMKTDSMEARFIETAKLLDYGFDKFKTVDIFPKDYVKKDDSTVPVAKGKEDKVEVALAEALKSKIRTGTEEDYDLTYELDESLVDEEGALLAPVKKGDKVGVAKLVYKDSTEIPHITNLKKAVEVDIVATEDVKKKNIISLMLDGIGSFFSGLGSKIKNLF